MTWHIFTGDRDPHEGELPPEPPWRRFPMTSATPESATYQAYPELVDAINTAIHLRRPLLLTGHAGFGKSSVADAIARELSRGSVLRWAVTSQSAQAEGLYEYDAIGRLQHQQRTGDDALEKFIRLGPLGTALASPTQRVVLIDELDKSDIDLPGDLLDVLERGEFEVPELARHESREVEVRTADADETVTVTDGRVACTVFPIVVITSNGEREFPPAFLRRCVREQMHVPDAERLAAIVSAHLGPDLAAQSEQLIEDFARRIGVPDRPARLAIDQLLNTVHMLTRPDAPQDGPERERLIELLQRELRDD